MSDWDWVSGGGAGNDAPEENSWLDTAKHLVSLAGRAVQGVAQGASDVPGYLGDVISAAAAMNRRIPSPTATDDLKKAVLGQGPSVTATNKLLDIGPPAPTTKTEQRVDAVSQAVGGSVFPLGEVSDLGSLAKIAASGAVAGGAMEAAHEAAPDNPWTPLAAGLVAGIVTHHAITPDNASPVEAGMQHPEFNDLADRVIPTLEGGGTYDNPKVNPDSGATGPMQVTMETARDPGYGIRPWDGQSQEDLARVGKEKLAALLHKYDGDTSKALAAYNWGEGNVDHAIKEAGDNWLTEGTGLKGQPVPEETQKYVNKGMAMTYGGAGGGNVGEPVQPMQPQDIASAMSDSMLAEPAENPLGPAEDTTDYGGIIKQQQALNDTLDSHLDEARVAINDMHEGYDPDLSSEDVQNYRQGAQDILDSMPENHPLRYKAEQAVKLWDQVSEGMNTGKPAIDDTLPNSSIAKAMQEPQPVEPANEPGTKQEAITRQLYTYLTGKSAPPSVSMNDMLGGARDKLAKNAGIDRTASDRATDRGFGGAGRNDEPPIGGNEPPAGPPSGRDPVDVLVEAINKAKSKLPAQERLIAEQRRQRLAQVHQANESKLTGVARSRAMLAALKGPMDRVDFESIANDLHPDELNQLHDRINTAASLNGYEKIAAINGLNKLTHPEGGTLPYPSEIDALKKVFPKVVAAIKTNKTMWQKIKEGTAEVLNLSRAMMTTLDLSAPFTQASALVGHKEFYTNFPPMVKAMFSKEFHDAMWNQIQRDPYFKYAERGKVSFTKVDGPLSDKEEAFMSHLAQKIPGIGILVRGSDRAYVTYLNKIRLDVFKKMMINSKELGVNVKDPKFLNDLGSFINNATGRGNLGRYNSSAPLLSAAFFSPRMQMSRVTLMNPVYYATLHPAVRVEAIKTMLKFATIMATAYGLAYAGGAKVSLDPSDPDFLKVRVGDTRIGNFGAFAPWIRIGYKVVTGFYDAATGKKTKDTIGDDVLHFARTKLSPVASTVTDIAQGGKEVTGVKIKDEKFMGLHGADAYVAQKFVPMMVQDIHDAVQSAGIQGAAVGPLATVGIPIQTYHDTPKHSTGKSPWDFAAGGGNSNPWAYAAGVKK